MLEPAVQQELKRANRTVIIMHAAMMCEPVIYVVIALALSAGPFKGVEAPQGVLSVIRPIFVAASALSIAAVVLLKRVLLTPERLAKPGAGVQEMMAAYSRAMIIVDNVAAVPATLGFVLFLIGGKLDYLVPLAVVSMVILTMLFPRYEEFESVVMMKIARGETINTDS